MGGGEESKRIVLCTGNADMKEKHCLRRDTHTASVYGCLCKYSFLNTWRVFIWSRQDSHKLGRSSLSG